MSDLPGVVRFASVDGVRGGGFDGLRDLALAPYEEARLARLRRPGDRDAYRAAHLLARWCVARWTGTDAVAVRLAQSCGTCGGEDHGVPRAEVDGVAVHVSLSHTDGWVAAAASSHLVGVDVEAVRVGTRLGQWVGTTGGEADWLRRQAEPAADFLRLWTRKEALVKCGLLELVDAAEITVLDVEGPVATWSGRHGSACLGEWTTAGAVGAWAHLTEPTSSTTQATVRVSLPNYGRAGPSRLSPLVVPLSLPPRRAVPAAPRRVRALSVLPAAIASALLLTGLTACGSGEATGVATGETRTVEDIEGTSVDVPVEPLRVVTLSEPTLDGALSLGVTPVGTVAGRGQSGAPAYLGEKAADVPVLGTVSSVDYEKIAAADPDLILVDGTSVNSADVLAILRRTAPTFYAGYAGGDWRVTFENVALALNKVDEGAAVVADYEQAVQDATEELGDRSDETFSIVRWQGGSASLILKELPAGMALDDLGLARPAPQDRRGRGHSEPVSLENLASIDADHLFFGTLGGSSVGNADAGGSTDVSGAAQALSEAEKVPGFTDLTAYRADQVHLVDGSLWTSTGGPLLMLGLVDSVLEALR